MAITHSTAAILSLGDELAIGQSLDTNSQWIAGRLLELGIVTVEHVTLPDDRAATSGAFKRLSERTDLIVSTGGLGPTADDLTRAALADALGVRLVEDATSLRRILAWFSGRDRAMPDLNRVQALRPAAAESIPNDHGTAPGLHAIIDGRCDVFCLPGPPGEMMPMWDRSVAPALHPPIGRTVRTRVIQTFGIGESELAARLGPLMERTRMPLVGTTASRSAVACRIRYEGSLPPREADRVLTETEIQVRAAAAPYAFGEGSSTLAEALVSLLGEQGQTLAVAESCTGGLLGSMVTDVPGSSAVLVGGWIAYSNEFKQRELSVPAEVFEPSGPGAVSRQAATAMASGGLSASGADHCLAITGVAGPSGGTPEKPVGSVWIALASRTSGGSLQARRFHFRGDRADVRHRSALCAMAMLRLHLIGAPGAGLLWQAEPSLAH